MTPILNVHQERKSLNCASTPTAKMLSVAKIHSARAVGIKFIADAYPFL
jgi:hypothetical protein